MLQVQTCQHQPRYPGAIAPDHPAARVVATHPGQGWSLLCNGVMLSGDAADLLPDGRAVSPAAAYILTAARGERNGRMRARGHH
ncbi:MAG TPA: DUF5999 family protein [Streptosporangiaceae bacterium]|nr:DUF5999 family protein [Streptosporangiaceae bacterium]